MPIKISNLRLFDQLCIEKHGTRVVRVSHRNKAGNSLFHVRVGRVTITVLLSHKRKKRREERREKKERKKDAMHDWARQSWAHR